MLLAFLSSVSQFIAEIIDSVFTDFFNDPSIPHDRVLLVDGKKFYVQSGLLSSWSDFFDGLFNNQFKESKEKEIELKEVTAKDFCNFLKFVYPQEFNISKNNYLSLIQLAHRFMAPVIFIGCREFIQQNFAELDMLALLEIALKYNLEDLMKKVGEHIANKQVTTVPTCKHGRCTIAQKCDTHKKPFALMGYAITENSYLAKNFDRVSGLSLEAKGFLLDQLLEHNYQKG